MSRWNARATTVWFVAAAALAAFTYLYALDSWGIPSNGDEYVYTHIVRNTAASGQWLPLQSDLPHSANTKPPLLFWQGVIATSWGADWSAWRLRLPGVLYTLATAALALAIVRRLSGDWQRAAVAAVIYLACYATYRYGRPFLTDAPETFWLSLIPAALLATHGALLDSKWRAPLGLGVVLGVACLYKSFVLIVPVALAFAGWHLDRRRALRPALAEALPAIAVMTVTALGVFAIWPLLDPHPAAIWREFVLGENATKLDAGGNYLRTLVWGGSSVPALVGALFLNGGVLAPVLLAVAIDAWRRRRALSSAERQLWIWVLAFLIAFALPSQRSGRYLLPVMPALAMLTALAWPRLPRAAFVVSAACAAIVAGLFAFVSVVVARDTQVHLELPWFYWGTLTLASGVAAAGLLVPRLSPAAAPVAALLLLLVMGMGLRSYDAPPGPFPDSARARLRGEVVYVPSNFGASEEGHRFLLPGADVRAYPEDDRLTAETLAQRYRFFAAYEPVGATATCDGCRVLGERYVVRGRRAAGLIGDLQVRQAANDLFEREVLFESARAPDAGPPLTASLGPPRAAADPPAAAGGSTAGSLKRLGRGVLVTLGLLLAIAALYYGHWVLIRRRLVTIAAGRVYQSGAMPVRRLIRYARRFAITSVIDFRGAHEPGVQAEARELARANIRHINVPMSCHPTLEDIHRFVAAIAEERAAGRRVLLHCKDGEGRAVCCAAIYRIEFEGWTAQAAFQGASRLPPGLRFVTWLYPSAGLMSRRNLKRPLILGYRPVRRTAPQN